MMKSMRVQLLIMNVVFLSIPLADGSGTATSRPDPSTTKLFAITDAQKCAQDLPYGPLPITESGTPYFSMHEKDQMHTEWRQVILKDGDWSGGVMHIRWEFQTAKTIRDRLTDASNSGEAVIWQISSGGTVITKAGTWWFSKAAAVSDKFDSNGRYTGFSNDDGAWGGASGKVDGDVAAPRDYYGQGNFRGYKDTGCKMVYTAGVSERKNNLRNLMYVVLPYATAPSSTSIAKTSTTLARTSTTLARTSTTLARTSTTLARISTTLTSASASASTSASGASSTSVTTTLMPQASTTRTTTLLITTRMNTTSSLLTAETTQQSTTSTTTMHIGIYITNMESTTTSQISSTTIIAATTATPTPTGTMFSGTSVAQNLCQGGSAALPPPSLGSTCRTSMKEGQRCSLLCPEGQTNVGYFTCSLGDLVGTPSCHPNSGSRGVEVVIKIASTLEVEIDVAASTGVEKLSQFFKTSIAGALGVSTEQVTSLDVRELVGNSGRRLRSLQTVRTMRFEISYEILPAALADVDALLELANAMTNPSTAPSQAFWQSLSAQVPKVHKVLLKIPARKFEDEIAIAGQVTFTSAGQVTQDLPESSGMISATAAISLCVTVMCVVCLLVVCLRTFFVMWKRLTES